MKSEITLNEQQINLLAEYRDSDAKFKQAQNELDGRMPDASLSDLKYKKLWQKHEVARINRNTVAVAFADCVANSVLAKPLIAESGVYHG